MSWLVDADVLSQPMKLAGNARVIRWLEATQDRCFTSAIVIAQLAYWTRTKEGKRRDELQRWLRKLIDEMEGQIYSFNVSIAHVWAEQELAFAKAGVRMPIADGLIAATARRHDLIIATGNDKDFRRPGLKVFNPFKELPEK